MSELCFIKDKLVDVQLFPGEFYLGEIDGVGDVVVYLPRIVADRVGSILSSYVMAMKTDIHDRFYVFEDVKRALQDDKGNIKGGYSIVDGFIVSVDGNVARVVTGDGREVVTSIDNSVVDTVQRYGLPLYVDNVEV